MIYRLILFTFLFLKPSLGQNIDTNEVKSDSVFSPKTVYYQKVIADKNQQIDDLEQEIIELKSVREMVLVPLSFPFRFSLFIGMLTLVAFFNWRNRVLIRRKVSAEYDVKMKNVELQNSILRLVKKGEDVDELLRNLIELKKDMSDKKVDAIIHKLKMNKTIDENWQFYMDSFQNLNPSVYNSITNLKVSLTPSEKRLCAFIYQGLTIKQIANITNVNANSVEKARYRLRKKFGLTQNQSLNDYVKTLS